MSKIQETIKCQTPNCARIGLELIVSESGKRIVKVRASRHDNNKCVSEFDFEELRDAFDKMENQAAVLV